VRMRRRAARPSTVFQLNQMAGKSKITPAAKRKSNERECSIGDEFLGVPTLSTVVITSLTSSSPKRKGISSTRAVLRPSRWVPAADGEETLWRSELVRRHLFVILHRP